LCGLAACGNSHSNPGGSSGEPGATDFSTVEPQSGAARGAESKGGVLDTAGPTASGSANVGAGGTIGAAVPTTPPPSGRLADVQEADIYKLDGTRLFYLNTYRGLTVYDVADPTKPTLVSRLPVYGYPSRCSWKARRSTRSSATRST